MRGDGAPISVETLANARADRVVLEAPASTPWWHARAALVAVTDMGAMKAVRLDDGGRRVDVRLPRGAAPSKGDVWMVDVGPAGAVRFGAETTRVEALEDVARTPAATPSTWFLVRGDDGATFGDVMTSLVTLDRLAPGRAVIGALTAAMSPDKPWACPPPVDMARDDATVALNLAVREDGKVGFVHVVATTNPEFAVAAVFCVARQRLGEHAGKASYRIRLHYAGGGADIKG